MDPQEKMVDATFGWVTLGSIAPGVHAGSGSPPRLTQPEAFVRGGGFQVLTVTVGAGVADVADGAGVGIIGEEPAVLAVGRALAVVVGC